MLFSSLYLFKSEYTAKYPGLSFPTYVFKAVTPIILFFTSLSRYDNKGDTDGVICPLFILQKINNLLYDFILSLNMLIVLSSSIIFKSPSITS